MFVAHLSDEEVAFLIEDVSYASERQLEVQFSSLVNRASENHLLSVVLGLPDRQPFIDCTHPGMLDEYYVELALAFEI